MSNEKPTVTIKGKVYNLPPLNGGQVRKNWPELVECIRTLDKGDGIDKMQGFGGYVDQIGNIVHLALTNEYPHLTRDEVDTLLIPDLQKALGAVISVTRLGEVKAPAKAKR